LEGAPAANVTPDKVGAYLADLKDHVASTTMHNSIATLRLVAQTIAPGSDFRWLSEIEKELALVKRPRSKFDRFVLAEVLIRAGLTLIHEAELSQTMTDLGRACQFRNGLMIALLGFCPIRRKNFSALEIGRSFVKIRDKWWIVLSASDTKEKRADERRVQEVLAPFIDRYLSHYRPVLARSDNKVSALWLSANDGTPITANHVTDLINAATLSTVGVAVSPHLFRTAVASTAAIYSGENPRLGSALLHHTDSKLINEHYNRASSLSAAENFRQIVRLASEAAGRDLALFTVVAAGSGVFRLRVLDIVEHLSGVLDGDELWRRIERGRPDRKGNAPRIPKWGPVAKPDGAAAVGTFTQACFRRLMKVDGRELTERPRRSDQDAFVCDGVVHSSTDPSIK
jgi:site-specific recombinase XerD